MYELIEETIDVLAEFTSKGVKPKFFVWKNKKFKVEQITFAHRSMKGGTLLLHFAVSSGNELYKITFNTKTLEWALDEIYSQDIVKNFELN